ncbi:Nucleotide-binding universal stress protein, UspA family [Geodermatophilus saharensis]|uniref:Nucleotide-binding universal stress protein, UspA family n=1 Tax=Geodermatophilus saharensis TaxID=1137994 RepID=A0A239BTJ4_9ACTN|nr:universal stress protein [Geodermatophilus saharensis]SNS10989.1 Nucleotide-binding universal stress protein, UspA family [Geodermatophilus saharensis]
MTRAARTVVVGIDGSDTAREAAAVAVDEAARRGTALHLVHVLPWAAAGPAVQGTGVTGPDVGGLLRAAAEADLRAAAGDAADVLGPDRVSWSIVPGDPADALTGEARGTELLVLGSRGVGGVSDLLLGSTAAAVLTAPPCPVLLLPDATAAVVRPRTSVVAAVAGGPADDAVLAFAFAEASMRATDLLAVHAWQDPALETAVLSTGPLVDWAGVLADEQRVLAEALAGWRDKEPDVPVREAVVRDRPARALLAAGLTAELLVVGARRHHGPARLRSTTHAVVHRPVCPVAVVPTTDAPGGVR